MIRLHATCVSVSGIGILIRGAPGSGKSDLALRLIDEGADLVSDDYCEITVESGHLMAGAPGTIAGKLEIRGFGIVQLPHIDKMAVGLIVDLSKPHEIERLPSTTTVIIESVVLPWLRIDPFTAFATHKVHIVVQTLTNRAQLMS